MLIMIIIIINLIHNYTMDNIPVCDDLEDLIKNKEQIEQYGFFYFKMENTLEINKIYKLSKEFFNLNDDTKNKYEGQRIGYMSQLKNITEEREQLIFRPEKLKTFINDEINEQFVTYYSEVGIIASNIFNKILECYEIKKESYENTFRKLAVIHYKHKLNINIDPTNCIGMREHTDWGFLTLLWTDSEGLQLKINNVWTNIPMLDDYFIVNIGDMLQKITNNKMKSIEHRVMYIGEKYSVVYFYDPSMQTKINEEFYFSDYFKEKIKTWQ